PSDVLDATFTHVLERIREFVADLITYHPRNADSARLRKSLQPGRDINGVAEQVVALNYDVADMDADPKSHRLISRSIGVLLGYRVLNFDAALHGINGAGKVGDEAIARGGEDPTAMRGDQGIDDGSVSRERAKCADLISPHQAAI